MKMTKRIVAMAACAVMALSTTMSVTASAIDTNEQITSVSESANTAITVIDSISGYSNYAVKQEGSGSCWAACILSVLKYHDYRTTETFETIYARANRLTGSNMSVGDTILTSKLPVVINNYLGMDGASDLDDQMIRNHIAADEPLILKIDVGSNLYHDVVIYGYEAVERTDGLFFIKKYRIMDPWTGTCSTVDLYNYNNNFCTYGGYYYYSDLI